MEKIHGFGSSLNLRRSILYRLCKREANIIRPFSCLLTHGQANGLRRVKYDQGQLAERQAMSSEDAGKTGLDRESAGIRLASGAGLERECRIFARYLTGQEPSRYIIEKYLDFHQKIGVRDGSTRFDRVSGVHRVARALLGPHGR